ncbi:olfactory receptor class A-like protein 4 [Mantella aurantiaca]
MATIPTDIAFYMVLVVLGILGNSLVLLTVICNAVENKTLAASDIVLMNLAVTHILLSFFRNFLVVTLQMGIEVLLPTSWCRVFMFIWILMRSMSVWGTFSISVFHYFSIRNHCFKLRVNSFICKALAALWALNSLYYVPALIYTSRAGTNVTFSVQLISTNTRPVLGCVWDFPSINANLLFVTTSLVIHEIIPVVLMVATNLSTLYTLQQHSSAIAAQKTINRVASEKKAALVITTLVLLFVICWGTNVVAANFYNFTKGESAPTFLLTTANLGAYTFTGFSPLALMIGHSKLRRKLISLICKLCKHKVDPVGNSVKLNITVSTVKC